MSFNLIMISTEMEHGGNLLMRHFDGHPSCLTYAFESQIGTKYSRNALSYWHPFRYGYPEFPEGTTFERAWELLWDEEAKAYLRNPTRSKFKDCGLVMDEKARRNSYLRYCLPCGEHWAVTLEKRVTRANVLEGYFTSFFDAWTNLNRSGRETHYVGYNPGMVAETDKLMADFLSGHIIHVVRNPFSAYADYLRRPYPQQTLEEYCAVYNAAHHMAVNYSVKYPGRFHIIRLEDFLFDKRATLSPVLERIGIPWDDSLLYPSFNGKVLETLPPWGTVEKPTAAYNESQAASLAPTVRAAIAAECALLIDVFEYKRFATPTA